MRWESHKGFIYLLVCLAFVAAIVPWIYGAEYYTTPLVERPFHPQYEQLKPSGLVAHGYGIVGTMMIIGGVILYSSRKRIRILSSIGTLPRFLEVHIFLCLAGPILVVYHTSFKFGGLVSVSFWSMTAVVMSGVIGRYLYLQIPRGIQGHALSLADLNTQLTRFTQQLNKGFGLSPQAIEGIDALLEISVEHRRMNLPSTLWFLVVDDLVRVRAIGRKVRQLGLQRDVARSLTALFRARHILHRRILLLEKVGHLFHYWHVVHLPFSIIMFIILVVHVGVAVALGYVWVL
jgi:hypothetical protein